MTTWTRSQFGPRLRAWGLALALLPLSALADGIGQFRAFLQDSRGAQGTFVQTVISRSGRKPQVSEGSFAFQRPGRFRWDYRSPYPQLLVGDGQKLWSWDRDLNQVVVKPLGDALGSTPAAILAGEQAIDKNFEVTEAAPADGLDWVNANPKTPSNFQSMRLGFAGGALKRMELHDNFGQTTLLEFTRLERVPNLDPSLFRFTAPKGADVIGE
jgi:outer membrane lipoprotein carrier protein